MLEYLGMCLPVSRYLLMLAVVGSTLGAVCCCARWWLCGHAGERDSRHLAAGAFIAVLPWIAIAGVPSAFGEHGRSCQEIQETLSLADW
jgi:hypothetical protein